MVYKKYIKKNGKFYGPYIYNSRRINGKVISEYQGVDKKDNKRFVFLILGILFVVLLIFFIFNFRGKISGNVIANNPISSQTENSLEANQTATLIYPNVYFTLISTQKEISNQTANIQNSDNNTMVNNSSTTEINSTETLITNETNSSISSEQLITSENQTPTETTITNSSEQPSTTEVTNSETTNTSAPETTSTSITGNVISGILKTVSNFFLGFLKPTGMAVQQNVNGEIQGQVSADNQFSYSLNDGETVQLLSGSVKTDSKTLSDKVIQITYQGNNILVSTNYSETIQSNATKLNSTQLNSTVVQINFNVEQLTEQEKGILNQEFGNYSIQTTKSELFNGRYVIGYQLGDYNIEYSYDSNLSSETLKTQIENDKIKWLRDIANGLSNASPVAQSYSLSA